MRLGRNAGGKAPDAESDGQIWVVVPINCHLRGTDTVRRFGEGEENGSFRVGMRLFVKSHVQAGALRQARPSVLEGRVVM